MCGWVAVLEREPFLLQIPPRLMRGLTHAQRPVNLRMRHHQMSVLELSIFHKNNTPPMVKGAKQNAEKCGTCNVFTQFSAKSLKSMLTMQRYVSLVKNK